MSSTARVQAVVSTIGPDRPGLVEAVSSWLLACGGNIEESRMAVLGGDFATIILVSGPVGLVARLEEGRQALESAHRLHIFVRESREESGSGEAMLRYHLSGTALDQAGIVNLVARELSGRRINIIAAETSTEPAPFSGAPVFHFAMEIDIPATVPIGQVRAALAELGDRENLDLVLRADVP
ncbi:hypothetical protein GC173_10245 [bacterium]|nr:hypothetical protein [bacterium]